MEYYKVGLGDEEVRRGYDQMYCIHAYEIFKEQI